MSIHLLLKKFLKRVASMSVGSLKSEIIKVFAFTLFLYVLFGWLFYLAEKSANPELTLSDSIWWAVVTTTTVGYGDFFPRTFMGRYVISFPLMMIGIGTIGYLVGLLANALLEYNNRKTKGLMEIKAQNHVIICNFPNPEKILDVMEELRALSDFTEIRFVLITDQIAQLPEELKNKHLDFVHGNPTQENILNKAKVLDSAGVFILASNPNDLASDERTFAIGTVIETMSKTHNMPVKTVVELVSNKNLGFLKKSGVDSIISAEGINSCLLVQEFLNQGISEVFSQLLSNSVGSQFYIFKTRLKGRKVSDIQQAVLRHETNMQVIGLIKGNQQILNPAKSVVINEGDQLIMLAENREDFESIQNDILATEP
ncbi:MAG TPA: potassium channel protein [Verrucomicrobiales bacterium]|nr:potassium channel protein [Verrucomicrobiales bacterium]